MRKRQKQGGGTPKKRRATVFVNPGKNRPNWKGESGDDRGANEMSGRSRGPSRCSGRIGFSQMRGAKDELPLPEDDSTFHPTSLHIQHFPS